MGLFLKLYNIDTFYIFQTKLLSQDVNEKTFDFVMSGVSSVIGGFNRYSIMESIRNFDTNFFKKWLVGSSGSFWDAIFIDVCDTYS